MKPTDPVKPGYTFDEWVDEKRMDSYFWGDGYSPKMPAYDLTPEQLKDLSAFLLSLDFSNAKAVKKPVPEILETSRAPQASPNVAAVPGS